MAKNHFAGEYQACYRRMKRRRDRRSGAAGDTDGAQRMVIFGQSADPRADRCAHVSERTVLAHGSAGTQREARGERRQYAVFDWHPCIEALCSADRIRQVVVATTRQRIAEQADDQPAGSDAHLSADEVRYVARLALLELTDAEVELFTAQLGDVLDTADAMAALDLDGVEPTHHPLALTNVFRADERRPSLDRDEVLSQAPDVEDHRFKVPPALGEP